MDNLNGEEIKPRKKTHKFLKGLIVIVFALLTYFAAFYLGNIRKISPTNSLDASAYA